MTRRFATVDDFVASAGQHLGYSGWRTVEQRTVCEFADATGDKQWIHVDTDRAARGPFGGTIAHGYLVLSMIPALSDEIFGVDSLKVGVNYGLDRVRFLSPVRTGSCVRAGAVLESVAVVGLGRLCGITYTIELWGSERPALIAQTLSVFGE